MKKKRRSDIDFEIAFFEGVLERHQDYVDALAVLGNLYTQRGFFEKGLAVDLKLVALVPGDRLVHYNLGCSYALTAQADLAFEALERAFELGYRDWRHMETDRDVAAIRDDPRYGRLVSKMQRTPT